MNGVKTVDPITVDRAHELGREAGSGNAPSDETVQKVRDAGVEAVHSYQRGAQETGGTPSWQKEAAAAALNRDNKE